MEIRTCPQCLVDRPLEDFRRLTGLQDKFNKLCRSCIEPNKIRYANEREDRLLYQKQYRDANKAYYSNYRRQWGQNNKKVLQKWSNEKYEKDPAHRAVQLTRARLRNLIEKCFQFEAEIGCSFTEFKTAMEQAFRTGMTWENYGKGEGKWTIDHIKSASKGIKDGDNVNHYTNLQPMWGKDNSKKGNR